MYLTETHRVYKDNPYYKMLDDYCFKAKNLYNNGMYLNSDVNGSYQILKKVIGDYFVKPTSLKVLEVT